MTHPIAPTPRGPNAIALTSPQLDKLLGVNANPFCGPLAVWWFSPGDWPFAGKRELWRRAEKLARENEG
jgi:hypothetical protein